MPLEAGENPRPLTLFDIPGVGFSPPPPKDNLLYRKLVTPLLLHNSYSGKTF